MESLDKALEREDYRNQMAAKYGQEIKVNTISDIRRVISEFGPNANSGSKPTKLSTTLAVDENNSRTIYNVEAVVQSRTRRDMIIDSLNTLKNRIQTFANAVEPLPIEINGKLINPVGIKKSIDGIASIDLMIKKWFDAYRHELLICWDLPDGYVYKYDIFSHKLTRSIKNPDPSTSTLS